jgi:8-oxo-dGTP diphosphatase
MTSSDEAAFLAAYEQDAWPRPSVAVDLAIFTVRDGTLEVLLVKRGQHPFLGEWALPGGFVRVGADRSDQGEDVEAAAHRELASETGLPERSVYLEQLYTFGRAGRDPRMRVISVAWFALVPPHRAGGVQAGDDAADARWVPYGELNLEGRSVSELRAASASREADAPGGGGLAFDHAEILSVAVDRLRGKLSYAPIAHELVPEQWTAAELRTVYEAIEGQPLQRSNFYRRLRRLEELGHAREVGKRSGRGRPARTWTFRRSEP